MKSKQIIYQKQLNNEFPFLSLEVKNGKMYPKSESFGLMHWHEEFQLIYVISGNIVVKTLNQELTVKSGQAVFINKNIIHLISSNDKTHYISFLFLGGLISSEFSHFRTLIEELAQDLSKKIIYFDRFSRNDSIVIDFLKKLQMSVPPKKAIDYFHIQLLIANLCYHLFTIDNIDKESLPENLIMESMLHYIAEHYYESISLSDIAKSAHVSISMCQRQFKAIFEVTPHQYINHYRLEKSKTLLYQQKLSIAEIAQAVGFSQSSHFSSLFKARYGVSPKQYQNSQK
ncbi:AraC family transcriptional regulator [Streptococcus urinalis]|nr:AraC family transcriptional regulator [Streptococcus urinalis]